VSDKPPPFANYLPVSTDDIWERILSGEVAPHIYSSKARGDLGPVAISAAEFFLANQAGQTADDGDPDPALKPYQIMARDRDRRRPAAVRHRIPVQHWVYVAKAALPSAQCVEGDETSLRPASKTQIQAIVRAVYAEPGKPPNIRELPKVVRPRLHQLGFDASENQIAGIGNDPEFKRLRRPLGRTVASERTK
jgi:hypothetical protein